MVLGPLPLRRRDHRRPRSWRRSARFCWPRRRPVNLPNAFVFAAATGDQLGIATVRQALRRAPDRDVRRRGVRLRLDCRPPRRRRPPRRTSSGNRGRLAPAVRVRARVARLRDSVPGGGENPARRAGESNRDRMASGVVVPRIVRADARFDARLFRAARRARAARPGGGPGAACGADLGAVGFRSSDAACPRAVTGHRRGRRRALHAHSGASDRRPARGRPSRHRISCCSRWRAAARSRRRSR